MIIISDKDQVEMIRALQQALADYRGAANRRYDDDDATNGINYCISMLGGERNGHGGSMEKGGLVEKAGLVSRRKK